MYLIRCSHMGVCTLHSYLHFNVEFLRSNKEKLFPAVNREVVLPSLSAFDDLDISHSLHREGQRFGLRRQWVGNLSNEARTVGVRERGVYG